MKADDFEAAKNNKDLMTHSSDVVWDQQDLQTKDPMAAKIHKLASPTFMTALNAAGSNTNAPAPALSWPLSPRDQGDAGGARAHVQEAMSACNA